MQLSERQQRLAYLGAVAAAVAFVAIHASRLPETSAFAFTGIGLLLAAALFFAARTRRLVLTAFAALLVSFGPWGTFSLLGAPYVAAGGLLVFRASRVAAEAAPARERRRRRRREPEGEDVAPAPAPRKPPPPSKRYTPPKR